jgi:hypothetical protein
MVPEEEAVLLSLTQTSSPAKAGDPVFQGFEFQIERCGVLDTPLSRGMTAIAIYVMVTASGCLITCG